MDNSNSNGRTPLTRRSFLRVFGLTAAPFVLSAYGCRPTDTLTQVVHADWATDIDYDNPTKSLKNAPDREPTTSLPKLYETESENVEQEMEDPVYDETSTDSTTTAPQTEYQKDAEEKDNTKGKKDTPKESEEEPEEKPKEKSYGKKRSSVGGNDVGTNASSDATAEPDKSGSVIAVGEIANIVALLGGKDALWATDDVFMRAGSQIYASSTLSATRSGYWSTYSTSGKTMKAKTFSKLCKALDKVGQDALPAYFIYDGSVGCPITTDQAAHLQKEYGIESLYFFLNTVDTLKNAMNYIKKILKDSFEHDATQRYDEYWDFHDKLLEQVNDAQVAAWGAETSPNMNFKDGGEFKSSQVMDSTEAYWTLLINGWDTGVSYNQGGIKAKYGLGYSTLGWQWSPVSYYLQQGGVINNAAARYQASGNSFNAKTTYNRYVWQMGLYYYMPTTRYLTGASLRDDEDTIHANADGDILMRAQSGKFGLGNLAGTGRFPAVIVPTKKIKKYLEADRDSGSGVYSPHYLETNSTGNNAAGPVMGVVYESSKATKGSLWLAYVGREDGDIDERTADTCFADSKYKSTTKAYDVLVNPHGVYSDWIDGSVESFLECAWANQEIAGAKLSTDYGNSAEAIVSTFYETFYGASCSNSQASKILAGNYAS